MFIILFKNFSLFNSSVFNCLGNQTSPRCIWVKNTEHFPYLLWLMWGSGFSLPCPLRTALPKPDSSIFCEAQSEINGKGEATPLKGFSRVGEKKYHRVQKREWERREKSKTCCSAWYNFFQDTRNTHKELELLWNYFLLAGLWFINHSIILR